MNTTRRGLLGKLLGAAAVPFVAKAAEAKAPEPVRQAQGTKYKITSNLRGPMTISIGAAGTYYFTNNTGHDVTFFCGGGAGGSSGPHGGICGGGGAGSGYLDAEWIHFDRN